MIPVNSHHCNIFSDTNPKKSADWTELYERYSENLNVFALECNDCHWKGYCIRYGHYRRCYLLDPDDLMAGTTIRIQRVMCKHCGHTHAVMPEEIVPYLQYSVVFIYLVLFQYYFTAETVESICMVLKITAPQIYRWKKRFEKQKDRYLGVLKSAERSVHDVLIWLGKLKDYGNDFAEKYVSLTEKMPMQQHANPPNTCRPVFC